MKGHQYVYLAIGTLEVCVVTLIKYGDHYCLEQFILVFGRKLCERKEILIKESSAEINGCGDPLR